MYILDCLLKVVATLLDNYFINILFASCDNFFKKYFLKYSKIYLLSIIIFFFLAFSIPSLLNNCIDNHGKSKIWSIIYLHNSSFPYFLPNLYTIFQFSLTKYTNLSPSFRSILFYTFSTYISSKSIKILHR